MLGQFKYFSYIYYVIKIETMILKKEQTKGIEIDLTGPEGNAFFLIGTANRLSKQLGFDGKEIQTEMMGGDYEHLVNTFDKYFGDFVILYR